MDQALLWWLLLLFLLLLLTPLPGHLLGRQPWFVLPEAATAGLAAHNQVMACVVSRWVPPPLVTK